MENPIQIDDLGGKHPPIFGLTPIYPHPTNVQWTWRSGSWDHRHICSINKGVNRQTLGFGLAEGLALLHENLRKNQMLVLMQPRKHARHCGSMVQPQVAGQKQNISSVVFPSGAKPFHNELLGWLEHSHFIHFFQDKLSLTCWVICLRH